MSGLAPLGVYIHWPYCARICPYCDFNVVRDRGRAAEQAALVEAIARDLDAHAAVTGPRRLVSIFLGGGTPSLMEPEAAGRLIAHARALWPPGPELEIALEANPTDAEAGRFRAFAIAGVNRLSLGVQALDDAALAFLGRNHTAQQARRAAELAAETFPRLSLDLISALPGQSVEAWMRTLEAAVALGAEHISAYQLTIEPGTAFGRAVRRGRFTPTEPELAADLYEATQSVLGGFGFEAYEVSNHARGEAARSRHNLVYWRGEDYVGVGPGAHGRLTQDRGRIAAEAERRIGAYIARVAAKGTGWGSSEILDQRTVAQERLLMGLRIDEGLPLADLAALPLAADKLDDFEKARLISVSAGRLRATPRGRLVLDRLTAELVA